MPPVRLDDDLFIEPASDDDIVYGDNSTMGEDSKSARPYIRLTNELRNMTRSSGSEIKMRCDAIGTHPITFQWLKYNAPVESSRRVKIRHKETFSRLVVSQLDVFDSGVYQCIASNTAGAVNTTAVLKVKHGEKIVSSRPSSSRINVDADDEYDDYEDMEHPRGRLPHEEDEDLFTVGDDAAGPGYISAGTSERWLDDRKIKEGECVPYRGEACRAYLSGKHVKITTNNREEMYDVDRNLRAAMMFINNSKDLKPECKKVSHAVACFHMYKVCDSNDHSNSTMSICKKDCEKITSDVCANELRIAAQHDLVGDNPKALFPTCSTLPDERCFPVLSPPSSIPTSSNRDHSKPRVDHWCYTENGHSYLGVVSETSSGRKCLPWMESAGREFSTSRFTELRHAGNNCRNPGGRRVRPWCYASPLGQEEYCDVPQCPPDYSRPNSGISEDREPSLWNNAYSLWVGLSPTLQLAALAGSVFIGLLFMLLICACCCRRKGRGSKQRSPPAAHSLPTTVNSAPHSVLNTTYYRKLNGTSTPMTNRGLELASMMSAPIHDETPIHVMKICASDLRITGDLGAGHFGELLHEGELLSSPTGKMIVAIKSARLDSPQPAKATLEEEIRQVASLSHPNLLCLLGVAYIEEGTVLAAVYEYAVNGTLLKLCHLRTRQQENERDIHIKECLSFATQIAGGLEYLTLQKLVHRDVAARNVMIGERMQAKISNLAHLMQDYQEDYVKVGTRSWMPIRWLAKEALEGGRFSEKSDVWSYGVLLWEMYSYGAQPYEGYDDEQISQLVSTRQLLQAPQYCPSHMYSLMVECWAEMPDRRPSFSELHRRLQTWASMSPAHSLLPRGTSSSSHSGSSTGRGRGTSGSHGMYGMPRAGARRNNGDVSPLMTQRQQHYEYTDEDNDSD